MKIIHRGLPRRIEQNTPAISNVVPARVDELVQNGKISQH